MMAGQVVRGTAALLLGLAAVVVSASPDAGAELGRALGWARGTLVGALHPVAPGALVEVSAPDLTPRLPGSPSYTPPEDRFVAHQLVVSGEARRWWSLPGRAGSERPAALVLLHGSGRDGRAMLDMWQGLAGEDVPLLIAPDALDPAGWAWDTDGPAFLEAVLAEAQRVHGFDPARVYLFGHSAGGGHAMRLANGGEGPWRAAAAHAGASRAWSFGPRADAVPLRLYAGDEDTTVPLAEVQASAEALVEAGHNVELVTIPGHGHWYYVIGPRLARDAWGFLSAQ